MGLPIIFSTVLMPRPQGDPTRRGPDPTLTRRDISPLRCPRRGLGFRRDAFTLFILLRDSLLAFPKQPTVAHLSSLIAAIEVTPCIMHIGLTRRDRAKNSMREREKIREAASIYKGARHVVQERNLNFRPTHRNFFNVYIYF